MTDATTGTASEGGHWYTKDGKPAYNIIGKNGKERAVTLRDARTMNLYPGFSTIARLEDKPALTVWKINQAILSALTLPPFPEESAESFKARVEQDMEAQSKAARERGTAIHAAIEVYFETGEVSASMEPYVMPVVEWLQANFPDAPWEAEKSFTHFGYGYGGKTDLYAKGIALIDIKTKDFNNPKKVKGYDEHEMQLHAYAEGLGDRAIRKLNLFVSSTVPGLIVAQEWETRDEAFEAFLCLLRLWQIRKGYVP